MRQRIRLQCAQCTILLCANRPILSNALSKKPAAKSYFYKPVAFRDLVDSFWPRLHFSAYTFLFVVCFLFLGYYLHRLCVQVYKSIRKNRKRSKFMISGLVFHCGIAGIGASLLVSYSVCVWIGRRPFEEIQDH